MTAGSTPASGVLRAVRMPTSSSTRLRFLPTADATIGEHTIVAYLGHGETSEVFLAARRAGALAVIKQLKEAYAADLESNEMFLDEARIAERLDHPNVVRTFEHGRAGERWYLAMEYLDGRSLEQVIRRVDRSNHLTFYLTVLSDALAGLHHAHELADARGAPLGLVHRDISPHNLFVTFDGRAKVVDFGIAQWASRKAKTRTGVVKGRMAYMAPEQALAGPVDRRADLFSMGVILWEIVAGERFWKDLSELQILKRMSAGELPELRARRPDVPEDLEAICARALSIAPERRYATAREMQGDIEAALSRRGLRPESAEIGGVVAAAFAAERREVRAAIEAKLSRLGEAAMGPISIIPVLEEGSYSLPPGQESSSAPLTAVDGAASPAERLVDVTPAPRQSPRSAAIAVLVGVVIGGAGVFAVMRGDERAAGTPRAGVSGSSASGAAARDALIELRIAASPESARIYLDDLLVPSNPFVARFPRDGTGHRVRIAADGFVTAERLVVFARDLELDVALPRAPEAQASAGKRPTRAP